MWLIAKRKSEEQNEKMVFFKEQKKLNSRGQVAIFIALIFQVLFVFFAMVINVGLLVHHKINLQNSVDLAAYYGAMKQAEMMGAIGHINYQIRQSWKLLAYRYQIIGTGGYADHPRSIVRGASGGDEVDELYSKAPTFCASYRPVWENVPEEENSCKSVSRGSLSIPALQVPKVVAGFFSFNNQVRSFVQQMKESAEQRCKIIGVRNWHLLARIVFGYKQDQADRKSWIFTLANNLSQSTEDFADVDGGQVSVGMRKTFEKNLTRPNRESVASFKVYNSLATPGCGAVGDPEKPPGWLSEIKILPSYLYADFDCDSSKYELKVRTLDDPAGPNFADLFKQSVEPLRPLVSQEDDKLFATSIGVEKNPWCMAYIGVSATTAPRIPFMPLNSPIKLTAKAFAKPFGGRVGPWYTENWPRGSLKSNGGRRIDPLLPPRLGEGGELEDGAQQDPTRLPNFSRFVGDSVGIQSRFMMAQLGGPFLKASQPYEYEYYENSERVVTLPNENPGGDILTWDNAKNLAPPTRNLEIGAILPDLFDITYYSIDPDYYHDYFLRLQAGIKGSGASKRLRSDLGARDGDENFKSYSIRNQIEDVLKIDPPLYDYNSLKHYILKFDQVLTSWVTRDLTNYSLNRGVFGRCLKEINKDTNPPVAVPGNCLGGGRTGYSVKLVSEGFLRASDLNIGGPGGGQGSILNPPPDEF